MATNYTQAGEVITLPAPADVLSGAGVLVGSIFGIALHDAVSAADVETQIHGVFTLPKVSAQAWAVGAKIYWVDADKNCTTTAGTNKLIGVAMAVADNPSATGSVLLTGAFTV